jgi:sialate O-acetylesterase
MIKFPAARVVSGLSFLLCVLVSTPALRADVKMPAIFSDHMVLQQDGNIPVWGWADPGEAVAVTLGDDTAKTTADGGGKWSVSLEPVKTTARPQTLTIQGKNTLTINDVLVGDVWVCSGQSNMEFDLGGEYKGRKSFGGASDVATALPAANDPQMRLFLVTHKIALDPQTDVVGKWQVCTPDSAAFFSAVGYFFGRELRHTLNRPIGLIGTYWGGTPAQSWTSLSGLQQDPPFTNYVSHYQQIQAGYAKAKDAYPAAVAAYKAKLADWNAKVGPVYNLQLKQWADDAKKAADAGQPPPPRPVPSEPMPKPPTGPDGGPGTPTVLFNGMIAPIIPYGIKGAIWYQGEANAGNGPEYATLFPRMISDWRSRWNEGDFPFLYVQLAAFMKAQAAPSEGGWALLREAQLKTLAVPNTGMAVAIDIGNGADIHPKDKHDVGLRLALAAKHVAYGQDLVYSGPIYDSMKVEGNKVRLSFKDTGTGLKMGTPPWTASGIPAPAPTELTGFAIAGADRKWVWARAEIDGNDVVVSSDQVGSPVAVRYGWANNPPCNLYNNEGLPASPFRTDDWIDVPPAPLANSQPAPAAKP